MKYSKNNSGWKLYYGFPSSGILNHISSFLLFPFSSRNVNFNINLQEGSSKRICAVCTKLSHFKRRTSEGFHYSRALVVVILLTQQIQIPPFQQERKSNIIPHAQKGKPSQIADIPGCHLCGCSPNVKI